MPLEAARRFMGKLQNKDLLEAVIFGALYVAAGDGLQNEEVDELRDIIKENPKLGDFSHSDIERCITKARGVLDGGQRTARRQVETEIRQGTDGKPDNQAVVFDAVWDIAERNGLGEKEIPRLHEVCAWCGFNPAQEKLPPLPSAA